MNVLLRHHQEVLAASITPEAELVTTLAKLPATAAAEVAVATSNHRIACHAASRLHADGLRAHSFDGTRDFVAEDAWRCDVWKAALHDVDVGLAHTDGPHSKQDFPRSQHQSVWVGDLIDLEGGAAQPTHAFHKASLGIRLIRTQRWSNLAKRMEPVKEG
jgi:hypothetical protein